MGKDNVFFGIFSSVLLLVIFIIGIMTITSTGITEIQDAGDNMNDSNLCSGAGCFYNASITPSCRNNESNVSISTACATGQHSVQFSGFFGSNGIIILAIMGMIVVGLVGFIFLINKKK